MKKTIAPSSVTAETLASTVKFMDALSQEGMSQIAAIARLALIALEAADAHERLEDFAQAFLAIKDRAEVYENSINSEAGEVGCSYTDEALHRRHQACIAAHAASGKRG